MTVKNVQRDAEARTLTIDSEFDAPIERVWALWSDPRLLERWWGPPTYPATFVEHDLVEGGRSAYYMTGPDGDQPHGWWRVRSVTPPRSLEIEDGFADEDGTPKDDHPVMTMRISLDEVTPDRTRMIIQTAFSSVEEMEQLIEMGMEEGMALAVGQIDDILRAA